MSETSSRSQPAAHEEKKILAATLVGTTIEWYDFFIYAQAAGLVFASQFFKPLGEDNATLAQIISWASLGISFLFRPLGAMVAGHLGDKLGRKRVLAATLILMGASTAAIGLLPSYASIGIAAPVLLILLRVLQGFSAGGEWGGAALLAVEHAPRNKRGLFGSYPQLGVPLGLSAATAVLLILTAIVGKDGYIEWAWRIPFLLSIALVVVGAIVRSRVAESPVFEEIRERAQQSSAPLGVMMREHPGLVVKAALIFAANNAIGYMVIAFMGSYAAKTLKLPQQQVFIAVIVASLLWAALTLWSGALSDKIGRRQAFTLGYISLFVLIVPVWLLIDTGKIVWFTVGILLLIPGLALSYGPQSAMYAELFPRSIRFSGVSVGYALGSVLGGAFAPMIAQLLLDKTGHAWSIGIYLMVLLAISTAATLTAPKDLHTREL
ncbi:MFS transporter [Corynebacterium auriscanis]|uniref:MFS transporter n=1 Tax=Corynebacterium auriscanis TaxID=99807 RepID=A0A0A2DM22_9CORY|nr:MFS transporter [Corynebacterium auriscanis]KGM18832.1 MFS transporter [Corynebacterium auriscanis]WJY73625.1 Inner membrane metabolite transport protein YhjE [Corynebacterium auriscanis]